MDVLGKVTFTLTAIAIGLTVLPHETVLPREKPVGDEMPAPVIYAVVQPTPVQVRLENVEDRLRSIKSKMDRIEAKVEGQ